MLNKLLDWFFTRLAKKAETDPEICLLQRELEKIGAEYEKMSYEELLQSAQDLSKTIETEGKKIYFSAETIEVFKNGDIHFCIDADSSTPSSKWKPSYQFKKRKDGSVYY